MNVDLRNDIGSNKVKKIRQNNIIPGVVYSKRDEPRIVEVNNVEFTKVFKMAGTSSIIDLVLNGETFPVIVKTLQRHPVNGVVTHIDFQKLNMTEKIKMHIPIVLLNRDSIRLQPSILLQLMDQVEIECLPSYIPKTADIDVEEMDFTTPKFVTDTDIANMEGITILTDLEAVVCTLSEPTGGVSETEDVQESAEATVIGE